MFCYLFIYFLLLCGSLEMCFIWELSVLCQKCISWHMCYVSDVQKYMQLYTYVSRCAKCFMWTVHIVPTLIITSSNKEHSGWGAWQDQGGWNVEVRACHHNSARADHSSSRPDCQHSEFLCKQLSRPFGMCVLCVCVCVHYCT